MNRTLKIFIIVIITIMALSAPVLATPTSSFPSGDVSGSETIKTGIATIWKTVTTIVQMLAFGAVIFAGLRYMFSSADQRADIKKSLGMLVIGAVLVFAASTVVQFVVSVADEVI